jgi:hypothetical protein
MTRENCIRETLKLEYKELLLINIKYPEIAGFDTFNDFYKSYADGFYKYVSGEYFDEVKKRYEASDDPRKRFRYKTESAVMSYTVTLENDGFVSLYIDISFNNKKIRRSQTWHENIIFSLDTLFRRDKRFKSYNRANFYLTEDNLVLYNKSLEEFMIPLDKLKIILDMNGV